MKNHNLSEQRNHHFMHANSSSAYCLYDEEQELKGVEAFINRYRQPIEQILSQMKARKRHTETSC